MEIRKIAFLIPVFAELRNGNLHQLLNDFRNLRGTSREVELYFLVNNSEAVAHDPASRVFAENQETLKFLEHLRLDCTIKAIDLSTRGITRNMGLIRQVGLDAFREGVSGDGKDCVVVHLDADTRIPADFLELLRQRYEANPDLETLFFARDYDLRSCPSLALLQTHHGFRLQRALLDFQNARSGLGWGLATYQISSRLSALERVGGIPLLPQHEDTALTRALLKTNWAQAWEITMITEDRARPEGFTSKKRGQKLKASPTRRVAAAIRGLFSEFHPSVDTVQADESFLQHRIFHPIAEQLWYRVRDGELSYLDSVLELKARIEAILLREAPIENGRYLALKDSEARALPDIITLHDRGYEATLCPVAHAFPDLILEPTITPGSDFLQLALPHLTREAMQRCEEQLAEIAARHDQKALWRLSRVCADLAGVKVHHEGDVFLARWLSEERLSLGYRRRLHARRANFAAVELELQARFPDWLAPFSQTRFVAETARLRLATEYYVSEDEGWRHFYALIAPRSSDADAPLGKAQRRLELVRPDASLR